MPESSGEYINMKSFGNYPEELKVRIKLATLETRKNLIANKENRVSKHIGSNNYEYKIGDKKLIRNLAPKNRRIIDIQMPNI